MSAISEATNPGDAAACLSEVLSAALGGVAASVGSTRNAQAVLRDAEGLLPTMQAAVGIIVACESLQGMAKAAEMAARAALAEAMSLGATTIQVGTLTASLRDAPQSAMVTDAAVLSAEYMTTPAPRVDLPALRKALLKGPVPGAALSNGGQATVQIRTKG